MNESEIKLKERIEGGRSKEILSFQFKYDDTMQLIMKKIHEQRLKWKPHGIIFQLGHSMLMMNHQLMLRCHKSMLYVVL
jgi:hypothetical protein